MYKIAFTTKFKKSLKRCEKRGLDTRAIDNVIRLLANGGKLPDKHRAHALHGDYEGYMECHITSNWLLVWKTDSTELILIMVDTGTHSDIFG